MFCDSFRENGVTNMQSNFVVMMVSIFGGEFLTDLDLAMTAIGCE
jgi:hypothetical protein